MGSVIREKGKNAYIAVYNCKDPNTGKTKRKWKRGFSKKREARRFINEVENLNNGIIESSEQSFKEFCSYWLENHVKANCRSRTLETYVPRINNYLIPKLGNHMINNITPHMLRNYLDYLRNETSLSNRTIHHHYTLLRLIFSKAVKWGFLTVNPVQAVDAPRVEPYNPKILNVEEIKKLESSIRGNVLELPVLIALHTGMRRGEVLGLKYDDIDLEEKSIEVVRSLEKIDIEGKPVLVSLKTEKSRRKIAYPDFLNDAFQRQRDWQKENKARLKRKYIKNSFVITMEDGRIMSPRKLSVGFSNFLKRNRLPVIRFHELRHTHASLLLEKNVNIKVIQERLGHSSIKTTLDVYSQIKPEKQREAAQCLEKVFN